MLLGSLVLGRASVHGEHEEEHGDESPLQRQLEQLKQSTLHDFGLAATYQTGAPFPLSLVFRVLIASNHCHGALSLVSFVLTASSHRHNLFRGRSGAAAG